MIRMESVVYKALVFCCCACLLGVSALWADGRKTFSQVITTDEAEYVIEVDGTLDPENVEITIENLGDVSVVDPRISVNGKYDWFDEKSILDEVFADPGLDTDEEKAFALWEWVLFKRFQRSPSGRRAVNPIAGLNGYGYGVCGHTAAWLKGLGKAAGLQVRIHEIWGHTINEFYYNGAWHMLDGNAKHYYLNHDNLTVASMKQLEDDQDLVRRAFFVPEPWTRSPSNAIHDKWVTMYGSYKDNYLEEGYDNHISNGSTMSYSLRPGEKLLRWWKPELHSWEGSNRRADAPLVYANGRLVWEPDLERVDFYDYIDIVENVTTCKRDSVAPAVHIEDLHDRYRERASGFALNVASPYPIIGAHFWCTLVRQGLTGNDVATITYGRPTYGAKSLFRYTRGKGAREVELSLDSQILGSGSVDSYAVGFSLKGDAGATPPTQSGLESFRLETDLQLSPHSLPALSLGKNVVRYRDSSGKKRRVRITHTWREIDDNTPPEPVTDILLPGNGKTVKTLTPTLKWKQAKDPDKSDTVPDYQVMVSLRPDCRWPVTPFLHQNAAPMATSWNVPEGYLNAGTNYYWKVRARDSRGAASAWSKIFSFKTAENAQ
jgi:hypothetical protein